MSVIDISPGENLGNIEINGHSRTHRATSLSTPVCLQPGLGSNLRALALFNTPDLKVGQPLHSKENIILLMLKTPRFGSNNTEETPSYHSSR